MLRPRPCLRFADRISNLSLLPIRLSNHVLQPIRPLHLCNLSSNHQPLHSYTTLAERTSKQLEIKKSKFVAWAASVDSEDAAFEFLDEVRDPRATHNCWAFKIQDTYRFNDDGEPGATAGRPIYSSIVASALDRIMVVVIRYYGGIKLGTGGLVRAYGGVSRDCLRNAKTLLVKSKVRMELCLPFDLLGRVYPLMQVFKVDKIHEEYNLTEKGGTCMKVLVEIDKAIPFEEAVRSACSGQADIKRL